MSPQNISIKNCFSFIRPEFTPWTVSVSGVINKMGSGGGGTVEACETHPKMFRALPLQYLPQPRSPSPPIEFAMSKKKNQAGRNTILLFLWNIIIM